jgi:hypothetical protein
MSKINKPGSYQLDVYDNEIPDELQKNVYNFLLDSEYCVNFYDPTHTSWYPKEDKFVTPRTLPGQPKLPLAWDLESIKQRAPIVYQLWTEIDAVLYYQYNIEGVPESFNYMTGISPLSGMTRSNGAAEVANSAWRVYGNGTERELRGRTKSIDRDNTVLDDSTAFTLVYFASNEWHPQLYGETLFHSDDNTTGDHTGKYSNNHTRNFPIGDVENVVSPRPGRFMIFDSRYLHQIKPAAHYAPTPVMGVVFRLRAKNNG